MSVELGGPFLAVCDLDAAFRDAGVRYLIGGSVASSLFGRFRTTNDIDCLCQISLSNVESVIQSFQKSFIVDEVALRRQIAAEKGYNIIHESTFVKVDLFPLRNAFHESELQRAIAVRPEGSPCEFLIASPEDMLLVKGAMAPEVTLYFRASTI
jgi:hypothetical protein